MHSGHTQSTGVDPSLPLHRMHTRRNAPRYSGWHIHFSQEEDNQQRVVFDVVTIHLTSSYDVYCTYEPGPARDSVYNIDNIQYALRNANRDELTKDIPKTLNTQPTLIFSEISHFLYF